MAEQDALLHHRTRQSTRVKDQSNANHNSFSLLQGKNEYDDDSTNTSHILGGRRHSLSDAFDDDNKSEREKHGKFATRRAQSIDVSHSQWMDHVTGGSHHSKNIEKKDDDSGAAVSAWHDDDNSKSLSTTTTTVSGDSGFGISRSILGADFIIIEVFGLNCISNAYNMERRIRKIPGVMDASVNYFTCRAKIVLHDSVFAQEEEEEEEEEEALMMGQQQKSEKDHEQQEKNQQSREPVLDRAQTPRRRNRSGRMEEMHSRRGLIRLGSTRSVSFPPPRGQQHERNVLDEAFSHSGEEYVDNTEERGIHAGELHDLVLDDGAAATNTEGDEKNSDSDQARERQNEEDETQEDEKEYNTIRIVVNEVMDVISSLGCDCTLVTHFNNESGSRSSIQNYNALHYDAQSMEDCNRCNASQWGLLFTVSLFVSLPVIILHFGTNWLRGSVVAAEGEGGAKNTFVSWEEWVMLVLTTLIQFGVGWRFNMAAYLNFKSNLYIGTDMLLVLSTTCLYLYNLVVILMKLFSKGEQIFRSQPRTSFATIACILTLVNGAKFLEAYVKGRMNEVLRFLMLLQPTSACKVELSKEHVTHFLSEHKHGSFRGDTIFFSLPKKDVPLEEVQVGDYLIIQPGTAVPTDGILRFHGHVYTQEHGVNVSNPVFVDESALSGDPLPSAKYIGDRMIGGFCLNPIPYTLLLEVTAVGGFTALARTIREIEDAQHNISPAQRIAEKLSFWYGPSVLVFSLTTFVIWMVIGPQEQIAERLLMSLMTWASVMIIACPCVHCFAAQSSVLSGTSVAADEGIVFRQGWPTFERLRRIDTLVFEKEMICVGGESSMQKYIPFLRPTFQEDCMLHGFPRSIGEMKDVPLWLAACAEAQGSPEEQSVVGHAILSAAREIWAGENDDIACTSEGVRVSKKRIIPGSGVECVVEKEGWGKRCIRVGDRAWVTEAVVDDDRSVASDDPLAIAAQAEVHAVENEGQVQNLRAMGLVVVYISSVSACHLDGTSGKAKDGSPPTRSIIGLIGVEDPVRPTARSIVGALQNMNIETWMCTSDHSLTAAAVASKVGIPRSLVCSGFKPFQQADFLTRLKKRGYFRARKKNKRAMTRNNFVAMVGSGVVDAVPLSKADVGIAIGNVGEIPDQAANVVIVRESLDFIIVAFHLSKVVCRIIRDNSSIASICCAVMPLLAGGILYPFTGWNISPSFAAILNVLVQAGIISNSLRLIHYTKPLVYEDGHVEETFSFYSQYILPWIPSWFRTTRNTIFGGGDESSRHDESGNSAGVPEGGLTIEQALADNISLSPVEWDPSSDAITGDGTSTCVSLDSRFL